MFLRKKAWTSLRCFLWGTRNRDTPEMASSGGERGMDFLHRVCKTTPPECSLQHSCKRVRSKPPWTQPQWSSQLDSTPAVIPAYHLTHAHYSKTKAASIPCTPVMFQDCFPQGLGVPRTSRGINQMTDLPSLVFLPVSISFSLITAKRHLVQCLWGQRQEISAICS